MWLYNLLGGDWCKCNGVAVSRVQTTRPTKSAFKIANVVVRSVEKMRWQASNERNIDVEFR